MTRRVDLTDQEAEFLADLLEWWADGFTETKEDTTDDRTITDPEMLLALVDGLEDQKQMCDNIREKLKCL